MTNIIETIKEAIYTELTTNNFLEFTGPGPEGLPNIGLTCDQTTYEQLLQEINNTPVVKNSSDAQVDSVSAICMPFLCNISVTVSDDVSGFVLDYSQIIYEEPLATIQSIFEDVSEEELSKGVSGEQFKIKLTYPQFGAKSAFDLGEIITYDKFVGKELYICTVPIIEHLDFLEYSVMFVNDGGIEADPRMFKKDMKYFRVCASRDNYNPTGRQWNELPIN